MVPSYSRKAISGQTNYLGTVTSHMMMETEMGYRGSKSEIKSPQPNQISVKEQRVDGSCFGLLKPKLRFTLMGFERSYQVRVLSKQLNKLFFSTVSYIPQSSQLNPFFVTGFCDAECTFTLKITKSLSSKIGYKLQPCFAIELHKRDFNLLKQIKSFYDVGIISVNNKKNTVTYNVTTLDHLLTIIIPHFTNYPLLTEKSIDFSLWCKIIYIIKSGEHLTEEGFNKIISIKAVLN